MKSHIILLHELLAEAGSRCCTSTIIDSKRINERLEHEGLSFLTITLPQFGKDIQKCLDQGAVDRASFVGYAKDGYLPKFLQGFTVQVFERKSGLLLDEPSIDAIHSILQLTQLFGKIELPCSDARVTAAFDKYIDSENQVRQADASLSESDYSDFGRTSMRVWGDVFTQVDREIYLGNVVPRHGPGATADRITGNRKFDHLQWTQRLEEIFPSGEFLFSSWSHFLDHADDVNLVDPGSETAVRVVSVPKTLKTPRIIAIEPVSMMYVQQGIWELFRTSIEGHDTLSKLVGFSDQIPNQEMARIGSISGRTATLDLSEASDRVSNQLVRKMLANTPWVFQAVDACRSRKADVPGHGVIRLAKFASMGSALCFPFEAMVFLTLVIMGIERELGSPLSQSDLKGLAGYVRIYGDDIIVPVEYVHSVVEVLQTFGLVVNSSKSFWTGKFRESCGKEYYDGNDISIVKVRRLFPTHRKHAQEIMACISLRNQLYKAGWWSTCQWLDDYIRGLKIPFPVIAESSPGIGRHSFLGYETQRECPFLQRPLVRALKETTKSPRSNLSGYGALLKCLLMQGVDTASPFWDLLYPRNADDKHLERAGRPDRVDINIRWVPSY